MSDFFLNIIKSDNIYVDPDTTPELSQKIKPIINSPRNSELEKEAEQNVKSIVFSGTNTKYQMKTLNNLSKEPKMRVETQTWGLNETQLSFDSQINIMIEIHHNINNSEVSDIIEKNKYRRLIISHIKTKIQSYKHQDTIKKMYEEKEFIDFDYVVNLLAESGLKCHYCSCETYLLYEIVREMKQWSLDRINNYKGHNRGNLVMSCLECNLKRRRTNKDAFFMTKNITISREGINDKV
jgi:hypothetical protein